MTKEEMVLAIFLKRMPSENLTDANRPGFAHRLQEAIEIAELVAKAVNLGPPVMYEVPHKPVEELLARLGDIEIQNKDNV